MHSAFLFQSTVLKLSEDKYFIYSLCEGKTSNNYMYFNMQSL